MSHPSLKSNSHASRRVAAAFAVLVALIVSMPAPAQTFTVLHNFYGPDGFYPTSGLTSDRSGSLYGTFNAGCSGCSYDGGVFKVTPKGSSWFYATLYQFSNSGEGGIQPWGKVIFGRDGTLYGATNYGGGSCDCGVVFNLKPPPRPAPTPFFSWDETVLHDFNGPDGSTPFSDPIFDAAGNLYLPTLLGGANGQGSVVELTPSNGGWTETVLYSFTGGSDGGYPGRSLVFDNAGNIYGTGSTGGAGNGVVFELSPSGSGWTEKVLHTFQGGSEGATPIAGLFLDGAGNLYGGTAYEGAGGGGTVFQLSPSGGGWTLTTLYSFTGDQGPLAAPTMDATGTLYGTTNHDGAYNFGTVFKLTPSNGSWTYTSLHDFTGGNDGGYPFSDVLLDGHGNMFGTAEVGGNQNVGVVWEITP